VSSEQFLNVLKTQNSTNSRFRAFQSRNRVLQTVEVNKRCLNDFDDKRYILHAVVWPQEPLARVIDCRIDQTVQ